MLEALINPKNGDIIVVKPAGSVWGKEEVKTLQLIQLTDADLEARIDGLPHIIYPYKDQTVTETKIKNRPIIKINALSAKQVDISKLAQNVQDTIKDPTVQHPILQAADVVITDNPVLKQVK